MSLLSVIVILIFVKFVSCFSSNFKNPQIVLPKCCPFDEHLKFNGTYNCVHSEEYFQIFTESVREFTNCSSQCIDFFVNDSTEQSLVEYDCSKQTFKSIEYLAYPKCCRLGFLYDETEYRCVESNRVIDLEGFTVFNISLSHCPLKTHAIVDYLDYEDSLRIDSGLVASLSNKNFRYGTYCLDETQNGTSIVRACQKYEDVCKTSFDDHKIMCIRKCCPDGQAYKNSRKCVKTFNHGIHLNNNFFRTNEEDKFAIIQSHTGTKYPWKPEHICEVDKIGNLKCDIQNQTQMYNSLDAIYCTEVREWRGVVQQMVFLFFDKNLDQPDVNFLISKIFLLISAFFLALTLLIYFFTSNWMKLFEKANSCYCLITFLAYVMLVIAQFKPSNMWSHTTCFSFENFAVIQSHVGIKYLAKPNHKCEVDKIGDLSCIIKDIPVTFNSKEAIYCTEVHQSKNVSIQRFFLFFETNLPLLDSKFKINSVSLAISCFFFLLTMILYCLLPDALHLFGKSILCYCFITFLGYVTLSAMQFNINSKWQKSQCLAIGFIIMFTFLGSFTWLNIICFDMYMAFGTMKLIKVGDKKRDRKRFFFYNLYGWGVPTLLTLMTYVIYITDCVPKAIKPRIAEGRCFFNVTEPNAYDHLLYFVLPMTIMIVCNAILFLKTIIYYFKVKNEINTMNDNNATDKEKRFKHFNADREKMIMLMKLFLVMGISWLFEVFSNLVSFKSNSVLQVIEIIWDSFNSLQGLFIFCIFMVKAKTWEALKKKFCPAFGRRRSEHSSSTLGTTLYTSTDDPRSIRLMSKDKSIDID